jgi:hypothetical protein
MTRRSYRSLARLRVPVDQLLLSSAVTLVLTTSPVGMGTDGPALVWQTALAKDGNGGGGGNGHGGGPGGDHGSGSEHSASGQGHAYGHDKNHGGQGGGPSGYHDVNEFADSVRSGKALGLERHDQRVEQARGRYAAALV